MNVGHGEKKNSAREMINILLASVCHIAYNSLQCELSLRWKIKIKLQNNKSGVN